MTYKLIHGDCFEEMGKLESSSFDLILTDPPYGTMKGAQLDGWEGKDSKSNVLYYPKDSDGSHPTQKPVSLLEDLIKTFSNEGDRILDFTMGSGSTGVACRNCGRDFVGIEKDEGYFKIAQDRLNGIDLKGQTSIFTDFSLLEDKK